MSAWSAERRAAQAERIRIQKPWRHSTGPRSAAGKIRVAQNAYKHGGRCATMRRLTAALARQARYIRDVKLRMKILCGLNQHAAIIHEDRHDVGEMREIMRLLVHPERPPELPVSGGPFMVLGENRFHAVDQRVRQEIDEAEPPQRRAEDEENQQRARGVNGGMRQKRLVSVPARITFIESHPACLQDEVAHHLLEAEGYIKCEKSS